MSKHFLSLAIPDTYNPKILTINDESEYAVDLAVDGAKLEIYSPGFNRPIQIDVEQGFQSNISACALNIQRSQCGQAQADLPDGVYSIRYSVSPNAEVFVEYDYLRVTAVTNLLNVALGKLQLQPIALDQTTTDKIKELRLIRTFIDAAKIRVEDQHKTTEGVELLAYAKKRLDVFLNKSC